LSLAKPRNKADRFLLNIADSRASYNYYYGWPPMPNFMKIGQCLQNLLIRDRHNSYADTVIQVGPWVT